MKLISNFHLRRWDSSDPDRAPPPLPLNPSRSSPVTKPNTSATVAAAAEAFAAKARESSYTTNPMPNKSPEKSLIKGQYHKRMQSMQHTGAVKDLSSYLENSRSPERPPERSPERSIRTPFDFENRPPERSPTRSGTPTPTPKDLGKDIPSLRPSSRPGLKAILGETPPQSATMRALQGTPTNEADSSLHNITNTSTALVRTPQTFDAISSQILSLTTIATNLQREMAQLSRRSKDNATDLVSLKEATNARDEDIRKSLRDLVSNLSLRLPEGEVDRTPRHQYSRSPGSYLLEEKSHVSPGLPKSVSLPRIPSPASFAASIDRDIVTTPNPYSVDGAAAIALLEKILREMGTKEGQERLVSSLSSLASKQGAGNSDASVPKQLEEITRLLKESTESQALVRTDNRNGNGGKIPQLNLDYNEARSMPLSQASRNITPYGANMDHAQNGNPRPADFVTEDILKLLKRMKDSITEGGGMSAEIKALVRELRGEVLGMGREIGRKLDQAESTQNSSARDDAQGPGREEIAKIVEDGLLELKDHMDRVMKEHRRQSSASIMFRNAVDSQEIYSVVKNALQDLPIPQPVAQGSGIEREEILEAVREAWETYKPEIELQNFGLERDEILECLKEGLQGYKAESDTKEIPGATYEEVLHAVKVGLQDFKAPAPVETESSITREEIIMTVRECLESFEFPTAPLAKEKELEITREDVLDAVKEGLTTHAPIAKELEFNREDLFDAVKAGLEGVPTPMAGVGEQVMEKMEDLIEGMRGEFQQYSAANGRDTEQVLDAMKDGLEVLRASIETYVDRASDVTGKDEIIETVRDGLENLRIDLEGSIASAPRPVNNSNSGELLDAMEKEFEHLRSTISSSMARSEAPDDGREEILDAIKDGFDEMKNKVVTIGSDSDPEALVSIKDELQHLRETLASTLTRSNSTIDREEIIETIRESIDNVQLANAKDNGRSESILSNTGELLDAFNGGLDDLKVDIERMVNKPIDMTVNYDILETLKDGIATVRADIEQLKTQQAEQENTTITRGREIVVADEELTKGLSRPDIENLEVMITQLKIKVEALDNMPPPPPPNTQLNEDIVLKADFERLESIMKELQESTAAQPERETIRPENAASKEDTEAIETLLRNVKAKLDDMVIPEPEGMAKSEHLDAVETLLRNTKDTLDDFALRHENDGVTKQDFGSIETIVKDLQASIEELRENLGDDSPTKADIEILGTICAETRAYLSDMVPEGESIPTKSDMNSLQTLVKEFHDKVETDAELTAQAFDARKIEHAGIADKIEDIKAFLDDVRQELKSKIEGSGKGIDGLTETLTALGEAVTTADSSATIQELREVIDREFERTHGQNNDFKADMEQHRDALLGKHDEQKVAIVEELVTKIDARFDEMMIKYDDAQLAADAKASGLEEKNAEQADAVSGTKAIAEELKLTIDTLGSVVTDSCKTMNDDSKTVFIKVEELSSKVDETIGTLNAEGKSDHQLTRAEVSKAMVAIEGLQAHASEYDPKIMNAMSDILNIVGQHFEQAQRSTEEIKTSVSAIPNSIPMPALPAPMPSPTTEREITLPEKYDDSGLHSKLDKLVECATEAAKSAAQFELLEQIKGQVTTTAAGFDAFVKSQLALTADTQESRAREAEEVGIALEKRSAQKEAVESEIVRLSEEKETLLSSKNDLSNSVTDLKREEKELLGLKLRLQADLSSLETALQIRREEMQFMESRAEALERRVIEGVLDHSRSLLLMSKPKASLKSMDLKRVPSAASSATVTTSRDSALGKAAPSAAPSAVSSAVGMALKRRQPTTKVNGSPSTFPKGNRRILSLSTIGANKGAGERSMVLADASTANKSKAAFGGGALKRSHSVKSNFPVRKTSWGGTKHIGMYGDDITEDKENSVLEEEEEDSSEDGTERRTSYTGTYTETDFESEGYRTGSVTDAGEDRRTSYAASVTNTVAGTVDDDGTDPEQEDDEELSGRNMQLYQGDVVREKDGIDGLREIVVYGLPTDSGIGSEPATAALEGGGEFFKRD